MRGTTNHLSSREIISLIASGWDQKVSPRGSHYGGNTVYEGPCSRARITLQSPEAQACCLLGTERNSLYEDAKRQGGDTLWSAVKCGHFWLQNKANEIVEFSSPSGPNRKLWYDFFPIPENPKFSCLGNPLSWNISTLLQLNAPFLSSDCQHVGMRLWGCSLSLPRLGLGQARTVTSVDLHQAHPANGFLQS